MKPITIISGPQGSGKTWISVAIENQYPLERILKTNLQRKSLKRIKALLDDYSTHLFYDLIVVEECSKKSILDVVFMMNNKHLLANPYDIDMRVESKISIVFITQDKITREDIPVIKYTPQYHLINCFYNLKN